MNTTAQVKQAIRKSAQQLREEPLELLRTATKQVTSQEIITPDNHHPEETLQDDVKYKQQIAEQDGRHLQALESELKDIRRQKIFNELMQRIQNGEDVLFEEFSELSYEQKDVLKAQVEAVKTRNSQPVTNQLVIPEAKRGRRMMGGGQRQSAQKQTTRVEKPVPPSG